MTVIATGLLASLDSFALYPGRKWGGVGGRTVGDSEKRRKSIVSYERGFLKSANTTEHRVYVARTRHLAKRVAHLSRQNGYRH